MAQVVITSITRTDIPRTDRWGTTNVYDGSMLGANRVYDEEIEKAKEDGFAIEIENEDIYSKNCVLKDGDDYCIISILKKIYI